MQRYSITITGKVQGVYFRDTARTIATGLGLTGFARNLPDGSVHIEVEGDKTLCQEFLVWCRRGSEYSVVKDVTYKQQPPIGHKGFEIH